MPLLLRLEVDNALEVWLDRDGEPYRQYRAFLDAFGSEEYILVIYRPPEPIDLDFLVRLAALRLELEAIEGVEGTECLSQVYFRFFLPLGIEAFRRELRASPLYRDFLISDDGRTAAIWLDVDLESAAEARYAIVAAVRETVDASLLEGPFHLAGSPVVNAALDAGSRRAARAFFPLVFLLSAAVLLMLFRRPYGVLIPFLSVGAGIAWTLALPALSGRPLNMVTVALPPLVWVLGLSTSIHLLSRCRRLRAEGLELEAAIPRAMRELARPCLWSALTTALGFASLMASSMRPVQEMGAFAASGILLCLLSNFLLFPALARLWPPRASAGVGVHHPLLGALGRLVDRRARTIVAVAGVASLLLFALVLRLRAEFNVIDFFRDDSPIAVTYDRVLEGFTGPYSLEILLRPPAGTSSVEAMARIDELSAELGARPDVAKVLSAVDLVKAYRRVVTPGAALPADDATLERVWGDVGELLGDRRRRFYDPRDGTFRVSVLARPIGSDEHRHLVEAIRDRLETAVPASWEPRLTGIVELLVDLQTRLLTSQIRSFLVAFLVIGLVIALLLRSARYAALSLLPNLMPVLFALGVLSLLGAPLDPATVMIASVALGIAVDDSIHFLELYLRRRRAGVAAREALATAFQTVGRPMVLTSIVAALGFLVLCFSDFLPLFYFGLLTAVAMAAALWGALLLLPALLTLAARDRLP